MWVTAYTDASFRDGRGSWAVWLRSGEGRIVQKGQCPPETDTSTGAELYAVWMAVKLATESWPQTAGVFINADCQAVLKALWPWSKELSRQSLSTLQKQIIDFTVQKNVKIRTKHVKGHQLSSNVRAYLNNRADALAKSVAIDKKPGDNGVMIAPTLNSNQFTWSKDRRVFSAEVSDFGPGFHFGQIYSDACDEGLRLVSSQTGSEVTFYVSEREQDGEGDLVAWKLRPTVESLRKNPQIADVEMVIFND
jgi:ribonuclease HI